MTKLCVSMISACLVLLFALPAAAQEATCASDIFTPEELALLGDMALGDFCPNQTSQAKICIGDKMCKNGTDWKYPVWKDGEATCPDQYYSLTTVSSVDDACDAAEDAAREPSACPNPQNPSNPCKPYCSGGTVTSSPQSDSRCCTVTKTRPCMLVEPCKEEEQPPKDVLK